MDVPPKDEVGSEDESRTECVEKSFKIIRLARTREATSAAILGKRGSRRGRE